MKKLILFLFILVQLCNNLLAQNNFAYKRQLTYKQCVKCGCKKSQNYKLISNNLTYSQANCAEIDMHATLTALDLMQGGTSGGLFAAYNSPQEGCGNDCYHEFKSASDKVETVSISNCTNENQIKTTEGEQKSSKVDEANKKQIENINSTPQSKPFTGNGFIDYNVYGNRYVGEILNGKPNGSGILTSEGHIGYLECIYKQGHLESWVYRAEKDGNNISTQLNDLGLYSCRINYNLVVNARINNCNLIHGELYFESGNSLKFQPYDLSFFGKKTLTNGWIIEGKFSLTSHLWNSIEFIDAGCVPVFASYPTEPFLNGEGTLYMENGKKIKGNFTNDKIDHMKVTVHYLNGETYNGEVNLYDDYCYRSGYGVLTMQNGKSKTGYWTYDEYVGKKKKSKFK